MRSLLIVFSFTIISNLDFYCQGACPSTTALVTESGVCDYSPWTLVFNDEFNGDTLDLNKWNLMISNQGALLGQGSMEYNTYDNVTLNGGLAKIELKKETVVRKAVSWLGRCYDLAPDGLINLRTYHYTSSNLWSKYKFDYGKFEIRCRIPNGERMWPAFWLYGREPWSEIDIFEFLNMPIEKPKFTVHYDFDYDGISNACGYNGINSNYSTSYHTFTLIWDNYAIQWYVDGVLMYSHDKFIEIGTGNALDCNTLSPFQTVALKKIFPNIPMNIIFNIAFQNGPVANLSSTNPFFEVDYIRYYKKAKCYNNLYINNSSASELFKSDTYYNFYNARQVQLSDYVMNNTQYIHLEARDNILISPNTVITPSNNSWFVAIPNQSMNCIFPKSESINEDLAARDFRYLETEGVINEESRKIFEDTNLNENSIEAECDFLLFPNPTSGIVNVNSCRQNEILYLELINSLGVKSVFPINGSTHTLENVKPSVYIARLVDKNGNLIHSQKLIVQ